MAQRLPDRRERSTNSGVLLCRVKVAAANAAAERLNQHLTLARCGIFYVVDNEVAVTEDRSAHIGLLRVLQYGRCEPRRPVERETRSQPPWLRLREGLVSALRRSGKRRRAAGREAAGVAQIERRFKAHDGRAAVPVAKQRCLRVESRSSAAKLRRLSRNRRKYGHAPAAAPRCPSKPSAASQACCIAIS
jgi:hypothetical protein